MIDKKFFQKHQKILLWAINTKIGRWLFGVEKMGHRAKGKKIVGVGTNSITTIKRKTKKKIYLETQFFCQPEYGIKLSKVFFWLPVAEYKPGFALRPAYQLGFIAALTLVGFHLPILFLITDADRNSNAGGDGFVGSFNASNAWAGAQSGNQNTIYDTSSNAYLVYALYSGNSYCGRGFVPFDTTGLVGVIESSYTKVYVTGSAYSGYGDDSPYIYFNVVSSTEADPTDLVLADYTRYGTTKGASDKSLNGLGTGYKQFDLNATGLTWINKTGYTKLAFRPGHDFGNAQPSQYGTVNQVTVNYSENATNKPVLSVTHTVPAGGGFLMNFIR